jgi:hypothetical protein
VSLVDHLFHGRDENNKDSKTKHPNTRWTEDPGNAQKDPRPSKAHAAGWLGTKEEKAGTERGQRRLGSTTTQSS